MLGRRGKKGRKKEWVKGKKADYGCVSNRELIGFGSRSNTEREHGKGVNSDFRVFGLSHQEN